MQELFVDIHTHHAAPAGVVAIRNKMLGKEENPVLQQNDLFSCGYHPWYLDISENVCLKKQELQLQAADSHCLAIGEAGLDRVCETDWHLQHAWFEMQVDVSEQMRKPLIMHCVKAYADILAIRKSSKAAQSWIMHGYTSSLEMAHQLLSAGIMLSFGKLLLHSKAPKILKSLKPEQFFLETDEHDVDIKELYLAVAHIRGESVTALKDAQWQNFLRIFSLPPEFNLRG